MATEDEEETSYQKGFRKVDKVDSYSRKLTVLNLRNKYTFNGEINERKISIFR